MRFYTFYIFLFFVLTSPFKLFGQQLDYAPGEVIVQFKETNKTIAQANTFVSKYYNKYSVNKALFSDMGIYLLKFDSNEYSLDEVISDLNRDRDVLYAQINSLVSPRTTIPDDPLFVDQWYLEEIAAPEAWNITTGGTDINGREIVLAVMDRGFDINHADLRDNVWTNQGEIPDDGIDNDGNQFVDDYFGWNFELNSDTHGSSTGTMIHGTNVAGIAGARGDNDTGISGVSWDVKIMYMSGLRSEAEIIEAYQYIAEMRRRYNESNGEEGAYIVATTISLGITGATPDDHPVWCDLYNTVGQQGVLSVCATDNLDVDVDVQGDIPTTCSSEYMIAVTNTNRDNRKTSPAAYGTRSIDIGAPGVENITTSPNSTYNNVTGTSVSAPLVGGAIALLYSAPCQTLADQALIDPSSVALRMKNIVYGGVKTNPDLEDMVSQGGVLNLLGSMEALDISCNGNNSASNSSITIIQNPVQRAVEDITIDYLAPIDGQLFIRVFDTKGSLIYERSVNRSFFGENRVLINTTNLSAGIYLVSLDLPDGESQTEKVLIY